MNLPDWILEHADFDPLGASLPIVCTGGRDEATQHAFETIGFYYESTDGNGWKWTARLDRLPDGTVLGVQVSSPDGEPTYQVGYINLGGYGRHSIVTTCPTCPRTHRVSRRNWDEILERARASRLLWVDVSGLE